MWNTPLKNRYKALSTSVLFDPKHMEQVLEEVGIERYRQEHKFSGSNATLTPDGWVTVLTEEVGEAAKEVCDGEALKARVELVQVAAVAVAMIEQIDKFLDARTQAQEPR